MYKKLFQKKFVMKIAGNEKSDDKIKFKMKI